MALGFLITSLAWMIPALYPTVPMFIVALVFVALGEITQVSRYYEYISRLAPAGQQGLYMGYAFLPIGIGYFIAGPLGGYLVQHAGSMNRPQQMWWVIAGVGILSTILMILYDRIVKPGAAEPRQRQDLRLRQSARFNSPCVEYFPRPAAPACTPARCSAPSENIPARD